MPIDNEGFVTQKQVKTLDDPSLGNITKMKTFVIACQKEETSASLAEITTVIKKPDHLRALVEPVQEDQLRVKALSFDISKKDIAKIVNQLLSITTDPLSVIALLQDLDHELGEEIKKSNIPFKDNERPQFLITGKGMFIPGPPPDDYHPKKKQGILDSLLLKREQQNGINIKGAPKFVGAVDSDQANPLVASGHVFTEDKQISQLLLHGSITHRLMFDALCSAIKTGKLNLQYGEGKELTPQQLLELLVSTHYLVSEDDLDPDSLWELTLDTVADTTMNADDLHDTDQFNFSCRSPYVLNSLLLCFGKEVGLPNLERVLLDSHWKAAYEMVNRVKNTPGGEKIPESKIYTKCMEAFSTSKDSPGSIDVSFPFTLDEATAQADPSYKPFAQTLPPNIVRKELVHHETGEYKSWKEFFDHKQRFAPPLATQIPIVISTKEEKTDSFQAAWEGVIEAIEQNSPKLLLDNLNKIKQLTSRQVVQLYNSVVRHRADQCLNVLLKCGLNINSVDEYKQKTPLMFAKEKGDYQGMMMLVKAGAKEYIPKSSYSLAGLLTTLGMNKTTPALLALKELRKGVRNAEDKKLVQDMEHLLTDKSSEQQLSIIILDYVERHKDKLSPAMRKQIDNALDCLLSEKELSALDTPPKSTVTTNIP